MPEKFNINQQEYWDRQHKKREAESLELINVPNEFAKNCLKYIKPEGKVLEIGIANGRDSRYFVKQNKNKIVGVDISTEAIRQLIDAAISDGTISSILPVVAEASEIPELLEDQEFYDAFYSRSALHLDDKKIILFFEYVVSHLNKDGILMVEGKPKEDQKIERSIEVDKNCFEDIDGHIRRVWSEDNIKSLCDSFNLEIVEIGRTTEVWQGKETKFIHFIAKKK
ncbi:MAG: class I SAM-dependent methyltransferase [Minisyncoccia bacterium]